MNRCNKSSIVINERELPEKYLHICDACGKTELLSSADAFEQGWDFPGVAGIYKDMPNYGFGILSPRTCGDCMITKSLYWKAMKGEKLTEGDLLVIERIKREPYSLFVTDNEETD